jgi:outer membrane protein OmpA-like peptidoglycan-associated protein
MTTLRTLASVLALAAAPLAVFAQTQNFGNRAPSAEEIVDQLAPVKTRGITAGAAAKAIPPPSISMEIKFDFDSDRIRADSTAALNNLAQALQDERLKGSSFAVIGHTDSIGSFGYNLNLSQRRANSVKSYLVNQGVDPQRLKTTGKGPSEPLNKARPDAAENRRVEIAVSG